MRLTAHSAAHRTWGRALGGKQEWVSSGVWEAGVHLVDLIILTKDADLSKNRWEQCCFGQGLTADKARRAFQNQL